MSDTERLFKKLVARFNEVIIKHPIKHNDAVETKQVTPARFLTLYLRKELILLHKFSATRIQDALRLFICEAETILHTPNPEKWNFDTVNRLCIYYALAASCATSRPTGQNEEVTDETLGRQLINQSGIIFTTDYGQFTSYVCRHFSSLLSAIGSHSNNVYNYFFTELQDYFTHTGSLKSLTASLKPWIYMPATVYDVSKSLGPIASSINLVDEKYRVAFCDMIIDTVMMSFKRNIKSLQKFFRIKDDLAIAMSIFEQIEAWNEKQNCFAWPAQFVLSILQPSKGFEPKIGDAKSLASKIRKFSDMKGLLKDNATQALFLLFKAVSLSNAYTTLTEFAERYYSDFMAWYVSNKKEYSTPEMMNLAYMEFPIAVLFMKADDFDSIIVPILMNDQRPDLMIYMAKVIRRVCKQLTQLGVDDGQNIWMHLIGPTERILKRAIEGIPEARASIPKIVSAFQHSPSFMRILIFERNGFVGNFLNFCNKNKYVAPQYAIIGIFDPNFVYETYVSEKFWEVMKTITGFLTKYYCEKALYEETHFGQCIHHILAQVAEYVLFIYQYNQLDEVIQPQQDVLTDLEMSALLFLASHTMDVRLAGVQILGSWLEILHSSDAFDLSEYPIEEYQSLVGEAKRALILGNAHNSIKNALKVIGEPTQGMTNAYPVLFDYVMALTEAINPKIALGQRPTRKLRSAGSISELSEKWIGAVTVMFAICFEAQFMIWGQQVKIFLSDDGDLGQYICAVAPTSIPVKHFNAMIGLITNWIARLQGQDYYEVTEANSTFIKNAMRLARGLTEQRQWSKTMLRPGIIGQLLLKICSYCNSVPGEDMRLMCAQCIISTIKLLNEHGETLDAMTRHTIGKSLLGWLPTVASMSRQYITVVHQGLALVLDNLSLIDCIDPNDPKTPEEQAENQFMMYFASIKNRLDKEEASGTDMVPVLAALLKQNLEIGIEHCVSMGFAEKSGVRAAFIAAVASVFRLPDAKIADISDGVSDEKSLMDIVMGKNPNWELIELLCSVITLSRAEAFSAAMVEAAIHYGVEFQFIQKMITMEVARSDEAVKNTLFRGNAAPPRAVGHYPRVVGTQWMIKTLRPLMKEVLDNVEAGKSYTVDPHKLREGEDLEENKARFRDIVTKFIDRIIESRESMPHGIIRVSKMIHSAVEEKYDEQLANGILSGFLFLRFLLPSLSIPKLVNLPEVLPDKAREALTTVSNVLNTSILKGRLDDKGEWLIPFNDIAASANDRFNQFFVDILETPEENLRDNVKIDERKVLSSLHQELYPLMTKVENDIADMEPEHPVRVDGEKMIEVLKSMGQPESVKRPRGTICKKRGAESESQYDQLMKLKFPTDLLDKVREFIVTDENKAPDGSGIIYVNFDRLADIKDIRVVPYLFMKALNQPTIDRFIVVLNCHDFDEAKVPDTNELKIYSKMPPVAKAFRYICLETEGAFVQFAKRNAFLFETEKRFDFVKDGFAGLAEIIGSTCSKYLPKSTLESLSRPDSTHTVTVNGKKCHVRLHQNSVHILDPAETIGRLTMVPTKVIMSSDIAKFTLPRAVQGVKGLMEFGFSAAKLTYNVQVPEGSPLFEGIRDLTSRMRTVMNLTSKVKIDTSTLQWLMLNLSFVNLVDDNVTADVRKAALDLAYAIYESFDFERSQVITKVPKELLPENFNGYVQMLSEDLAANNRDQYAGFMTEFFKGFQYIENQSKPTTFGYLSPWISYYAATAADHPAFTDKIIQAYLDLPNESIAFSSYIWPQIATSPAAIEVFMKKIYESQDPILVEIVLGFAALAPEHVSYIWAGILFEEAIRNKDPKVAFVCKVIVSLISCHVFDMRGIPVLVYNLVTLRLSFAPEIVAQCVDALINALHTIAEGSGKTVTYDAMKVAAAYTSKMTLEDYQSSEDNQREWLTNAVTIASAFKEVVNNFPEIELKQQLFDKFVADVDSPHPELQNQGVIYASAMIDYQNANDLAFKLLEWTHDDCPRSLATTICLALSLIDMDRMLASQLFYVGACFALKYHITAALDLMGSAIYQYGMQQPAVANMINEGVDPSLIDYIDTCSALDFQSRPVFSALILIARICNSSVNNIIEKFMKSGSDEPLLKIFGLLLSPKDLKETQTFDFDADWATVDAAILMLLAQSRSDALIEYEIEHLARNPLGCAAMNPLKAPFVKAMLEKMDNIRFISLVARSSQRTDSPYEPAPLVVSAFNEEVQRVELSKEQFDYLIECILPPPGEAPAYDQ